MVYKKYDLYNYGLIFQFSCNELINPGYKYFFNFDITIQRLGSNQFIFLIILALYISLIGWLFINTLVLSRYIFSNLDIPSYFIPSIGGLIVGIIGYFYIDVMGTGSNIISNLNNFDHPIIIIAAILLLKIFATSLTIGSGGSGGLFAL